MLKARSPLGRTPYGSAAGLAANLRAKPKCCPLSLTPQFLRAVHYWYKTVMKYQLIFKKIDLAQTPPLMSALVKSGH
jgi:hypothetical protein